MSQSIDQHGLIDVYLSKIVFTLEHGAVPTAKMIAAAGFTASAYVF